MLYHSGTSHDVAEWCDVKRLEQTIDNSSNNQETLLKGGKFVSGSFYTGIYFACRVLSPNSTM